MKGSTEEFPVVPMVRDAGLRATGGGTPDPAADRRAGNPERMSFTRVYPAGHKGGGDIPSALVDSGLHGRLPYPGPFLWTQRATRGFSTPSTLSAGEGSRG
mgnify:CR=1 FL=1|jgi:hypothetical protein